MVSDAFGTARDSYLAHLTVERGLSANTLAAYGRDLRRYISYLRSQGVGGPGDVVERHIEDYVIAAREGADGGAALSSGSVARAVVTIRGWHRFLAAEGAAAQDPASGVRPPRRPHRLPKAISVDEVLRLLHAAGEGDGPTSFRDRALLELLYSTGARISEAVVLDVDDLSVAAEAWSVRLSGKGGKQRIVPVGSYAVEAVQTYLVRARPELASAGFGTPALFLNTRGARLSRQSAWHVLRAAARRAGLPHADQVSPHTLRHSYATHLINGGADVRAVQELLGHSSVSTTQLYTLVTAQHLREVYRTSHPRAIHD
jgi:integrase/recombinase XerD